MNEQERIENRLPRIYTIPISEIDEFPDHPFQVRMDEDMDQLVESVKERGVITPVTLRKKEDGRYETVSGHRRIKASELAGLETVPAEIKELTRDEAILLMVDSNLQRSYILPSEKAMAYKMRLDAMKRQGKRIDLTSDPVGPKLGSRSNEQVAAEVGDSLSQVKRYIRLTELAPDLLQLVDEGKIAMRPAVELSYREGGAGFYLDGKQYAVWYDESGFRISAGDTTLGGMTMLMTWEEVAKRVRELLELGRYMPEFLLAGVNMYERLTLASDLLFTARDLSDDGRAQGLLPSFQSLHGAFDDEQKAIVSLMASPESLQTLIGEWRAFEDAYKEDREIMRFRRSNRSLRILPRLEDLQREPVIFHGNQAANGLPERFITQDEIDMVLRHGVSRTGADYRLDIYAFFRSHADLVAELLLRHAAGLSQLAEPRSKVLHIESCCSHVCPPISFEICVLSANLETGGDRQ